MQQEARLEAERVKYKVSLEMQKTLLEANLEKLSVEKEVAVTIVEAEALELAYTPIVNTVDTAVCLVHKLNLKILSTSHFELHPSTIQTKQQY